MIGQPFDHLVFSAWAGDEDVAAALSFETELAAMLWFETELAQAEAECGVIPATAAQAIARVCAGFKPDMGGLCAAMRRDGVVVPDLIRQLRAAMDAPHARFLHHGATSQDVIDTALMLRLGPLLDRFEGRLDRVLVELDRLDAAFGQRPLMGYTRLRAALPITVGDRIRTWRSPLVTCRRQLPALRERLLAVQFGGPVGTLDALGSRGASVRAALARRLGLRDPGESWHIDRARLLDLGRWLAGVNAACGKIGVDLGLMAQDGIAAAILGGGGSSSMPHKVNPVDAELLGALASHAATLLGGLHQAAVHEYERSGSAWILEWLTLPPMLNATGSGLCAARRLLVSVEALGDPADR